MMTGALEAMVVDYQCIMPSVTDVAKCYHTQVISTSDKAKFPGATHVSFDPHHGAEIARQIVRMAVEAYPEPQPRPGPHPRRARPDDGRASRWRRSWARSGGTPEAPGRRHRLGCDPRRGGRGRLQQPEDPPGLRARRADPTADRERRPGARHRMRGRGQRQGRPDAARVRRPGRAGPARRCARRWASRRCCTWAPAWTTAGSWCWPRPWPTPSASTSTSCPSPVPHPSGTRRRRSPSAPTWWPAASPPCSVSSRRSSAARTSSICWPTASTTWWAPSSSVEPDPEKAALLIRRHIEAKRQGLGLPFVDVDAAEPVAAGGQRGLGHVRDVSRSRRRGARAPGAPIPGTADRPEARIVVVGKGGVGKPTITALLARLLARQRAVR